MQITCKVDVIFESKILIYTLVMSLKKNIDSKCFSFIIIVNDVERKSIPSRTITLPLWTGLGTLVILGLIFSGAVCPW